MGLELVLSVCDNCVGLDQVLGVATTYIITTRDAQKVRIIVDSA